ncbi:hypothetical protein H5993_01490 [Lactobacillus alvi]|uniref:Gram-positive cocci surface proteins LPxTG domain-containing protein n=1 Tax=Limosilactobacillus alvi TaxID=990412 RepID=A0ABS2EMY8_9LACO|nr:hypothetical protein [Limosilactobacillus alvi]
MTVDNTIHPTVEVKRVTASSKTSIVNNVDYEYQAQIKGLPGSNDSRFLSLAGTNPITVDIPMPAGFVLNDSLTKAKMDSLWGSGNYSYTTDGQTIKVTFNNPSTTFVTKYFTRNPLAFDFVGHYVGQTGTVTASANTSFNAKFGSNQESYSTATSQPVSETFATSEKAQAGDLVISGGYVDNGTTEHTIQLHNDKHKTLGSFGINNQGVAEVDNPTFTITIPSQFDVPANTLIVSRETFGDDAKLPDNLKYTITYADGSEATYDYATTPISSLPAKNISKIIFTLPTLNPGETYKFSLPGQVNSTAKAGDETSISGEIKTMDGGEGSLSLAQQIIDTTPTTKEGVYAYSYQSINEFRIGQYTNRGAQADITDPVIYYVLPKGFFYKNYQAKWTDGDANYTPKITTSMVNGQQVVKLDFTGTGFILNPKWGANTAIVASAGQDTPAGTYTVKGYIYSPGVQFDGMTVATSDNQYLGQDSATQLDSHWGYEGARTWTITSLSMIKPSAGVVENGFVVADDTLNDHGDGTATLGMNITNDQKVGAMGSFVYKGKIPDGIIMTGAVTGLPNGVTVKYTLQDPDLASNETDNYVDASQITDWSKVKGLALFGTGLPAGQNMGLVSIPVKVVDVQNQANKTFTFNARYFDTNNSTTGISGKGTLKVAGQSTLKTQVQYTDANGKVQTIALTGTKTYNDGVDTPSERDFPVDLASLNESDRATLQKLLDQNYTMPESVSMGKVSTDSPMSVSEDGLTVTYVLGHKTETQTETITRTTHYQKADGTKLADDTTSTINIVKKTDKVTGKATYTATDSSDSTKTYDVTVNDDGTISLTIPGVTSVPDVTGYMANSDDVTKAKAATTEKITFTADGSESIEGTVTYSPKTENANINFVDVTNNYTTLETVTSHGDFGSEINFMSANGDSVDAIVKYYEGLGYVLSKYEKQPYKNGVTYQDSDSSNTFYLYLEHGTYQATDYVTRDWYFKKTDESTFADLQYTSYGVTATIDKVTGKVISTDNTDIVTIDSDGVATLHFPGISADKIPTETGYHWNAKSADEVANAEESVPVKLHFNSDGSTHIESNIQNTIYYALDPEEIKIQVFDETIDPNDQSPLDTSATKQKTDFMGSYDQDVPTTVNDSVQNLIKYYQSLGYKLQVDSSGKEIQPIVPTKYDTTINTGTTDSTPQIITIRLIHDTETQTQTITRTINYQTTEADGTHNSVSDPYTNTVTVNAVIDKVTGDVLSYTAKDAQGNTVSVTKGKNNTYSLDVAGNTTVPSKAGYTANSDQVATAQKAETVTNQTFSTTSVSLSETVNYTPNDQKLQIRVFDDTVDATKNIGAGDSGQKVDYTGKTNTSFDESTSVSALEKYYEGKGYILDPKYPKPTTTGTYNTDDNDVQYIDIHLIHNTHQQSQTVTRTINYVTKTKDADGNPIQVEKPTTVTVTVTATIDDVTKDASDYTAMDSNGKSYTVTRISTVTNGGSNQYTVTLPGQTTLPKKAGYTADPASAATAKGDQTYTVTLDKVTSEHPETVTYTPNKQDLTIVVHDDTTNTDVDVSDYGDETSFSGVSDENVSTDVAINRDKLIQQLKDKGYDVIDKGTIPENYDHDDSKGQTVTIVVTHKKVTVTPNDPKTTADTIDGTNQKYPAGVTETDLNHTVTRTIKVTNPDGATTTTEQEVKFTRTATVDAVTGKVTYTPWVVKGTNTTHGTWPNYTGPTHAGYTPVIDGKVADSATISANDQVSESDSNQTINITYQADSQKLQIRVFDDTTDPDSKTDLGAGQSGDQTNFSGKTDETVPDDVKANVDALIKYYKGKGYVLVSTGDIPKNYDKTDNTGDADRGVQYVDIHLKHGTKTITVTPTDTIYTDPTNKQQYQLTYDAKRTITYQGAGDQTPAEKSETVSGAFTRQLTVDAVTGKVQNVGPWTGSHDFASVPVTPVTGYVADKATVPAITASADADNLDENGNPKAVSQTVTYTAVGRIIPVDANGKHLVDPQNYKNDSADPTKVAKNETLPTIPGYHVVSGDGVTTSGTGNNTTGIITPTNATTDTEVIYAPNAETITVRYVDADAKDPSKATLKTDTLSGNFGTDINYSTKDEIAKLFNEGYVLRQDSDDEFTSANQTQYTVENDGKTYIVTLHHGTEKVTTNQQVDGKTKINENDDRDDAPVWTDENGIVSADFTRTINYVASDGTSLGLSTQTQNAHWTRELTADKVTGEVVNNTDWTTTNTYPAVTSPTVAGYTPDTATVAEVTRPEQQNTIVTVTYTPDKQTIQVQYVDDDDNGKIVTTTDLNGVTNQTVTPEYNIPANYEYVSGKEASYTFKASGNQPIVVHLKHQHKTGTETKTITRTVNITDPKTGKTTTTSQQVNLTRSTDTDLVTNKTTNGEWNTGTWDEVSVPKVPGYTPSQASVDEATVKDSDTDQTVDITYTPNDQTGKISYVDPDGSEIGNTPLNGKTDSTVNVTPQIPAGWVEVLGQTIPTTTTATADGIPTVTVKVQHGQVTVQPDDPKTPSDKLPDNPGKNFPSGVSESDLNKTITRTINVTKPDGTKTTKTQTVHLTRTATVDEVTGKVTYSNWTTGTWNAYTPANIPGYTPSQASVGEATVTGSDTDQTVDITYTANSQKATINYVDDDDHGKIVHTTPLSGKTDQTVPVTNEIPAGYQLADGSTVPDSHTFTPGGPDTITVHLVHKHDQGSETHQATRTITVTTPDGKS